jgi:hypothetical protein
MDKGKTTREILDERESTYGGFKNNARIHTELMNVIMLHRNGESFPPLQQSALMHITGKIARMVSGNINYNDNWRDIVGYAQLVLDELERDDKTMDLLKVNGRVLAEKD